VAVRAGRLMSMPRRQGDEKAQQHVKAMEGRRIRTSRDIPWLGDL